jgi:hypothetical protein
MLLIIYILVDFDESPIMSYRGTRTNRQKNKGRIVGPDPILFGPVIVSNHVYVYDIQGLELLYQERNEFTLAIEQ